MYQYHDCSTSNGRQRHYPDSKVHGANMGPTGPRWVPCWPRELCYLGIHCSLVDDCMLQRLGMGIFSSTLFGYTRNKIWWTNPTMHYSNIPWCTIFIPKCAHVCTFVLKFCMNMTLYLSQTRIGYQEVDSWNNVMWQTLTLIAQKQVLSLWLKKQFSMK